MLWLLLTLAAQAAEEPALPEWMAGCWEQRTADRWTEECWTPPRGGMMMGSSRSGSGDLLLEWETMQIVREESDDPAVAKMIFWGSPRGERRTLFAWSPANVPGISFYNRSHDYPQRIRYWREGADLMAEISLADGSRARRWRYTPAD